MLENQIQTSSRSVTSISRFDLSSITDSIFLIKSLLLAIVKECAPITKETEILIATLKQEIFYLEKEDGISDIDFVRIDIQFYLALSQQKSFQRVTKILLNEKLYIDRICRLFLNQHLDYKLIIKIYGDVLEAVNSNDINSASNALCEWERILEEHLFMAKKHHPEFFK